MFSKSLQLIKSGIGSAFPCAAVAVGVGHNCYIREFYGKRQEKPFVLEITDDTLFDLASLSKIVSTTMVALKFIEDGKICLHDKLGKFLEYSGNYSDCEVLHLLTHTSGLVPSIQLFSIGIESREATDFILNSEKCYNSGSEVRYSCMGYIILQRILEKVGGKSLDELAQEFVFTPLGMTSTCYNPSSDKSFAATELCSHTGEWATGHVHDENSYFVGGVSGNAGVFSTLDDMISFSEMCSERGIAKNGQRYLSDEIFNLALQNFTPDKQESRGLGFQLKGKQNSPMGSKMSEGSYGHTGFTGTSMYIDKNSGLWGVLLTNAVHYGRDNRSDYFKCRKSFYEMLITEYYELKKEGRI